MWQLIPTFPREAGTPRRFVVNNKSEFVRVVNEANGIKRMFFALYQCDPSLNYSFANIDKVFFDFDDPKTSHNDMKMLHEHCKETKLRHTVIFSGGGYHVYIFTKNGVLKNNKKALWNVHHKICEELKLNLDQHIKGDVSRLARVPSTYNTKRRKYCISISEDDIEKGHDFIREKAKKPNLQYYYYGTEYLDMQPYDAEKDDGYDYLILDSEEQREINEDKLLKNLPLCISTFLKRSGIGYRQRYLTIVYLRELGYTLGETVGVLKKFLTEHKFRHCVIEERQVHYIYQRPELYFPNCNKIKKEGYCIKGCKMKNKIYL